MQNFGTPSGRKVTRRRERERERKRNNAVNSGHLVPWQRTKAVRANFRSCGYKEWVWPWCLIFWVWAWHSRFGIHLQHYAIVDVLQKKLINSSRRSYLNTKTLPKNKCARCNISSWTSFCSWPQASFESSPCGRLPRFARVPYPMRLGMYNSMNRLNSVLKVGT